MDNTGFIEQTTRDYDMETWQVQDIYDKWGEVLFYEKLEEYISERARNAEGLESEDFEEAVKPAIEWLAKNGDPHSIIIVHNNKAELFQGEKGFVKK